MSDLPVLLPKKRGKYINHNSLTKDEQIELRRSQNRESAKRCRQKKALKRKYLEQQIDIIQNEIKILNDNDLRKDTLWYKLNKIETEHNKIVELQNHKSRHRHTNKFKYMTIQVNKKLIHNNNDNNNNNNNNESSSDDNYDENSNDSDDDVVCLGEKEIPNKKRKLNSGLSLQINSCKNDVIRANRLNVPHLAPIFSPHIPRQNVNMLSSLGMFRQNNLNIQRTGLGINYGMNMGLRMNSPYGINFIPTMNMNMNSPGMFMRYTPNMVAPTVLINQVQQQNIAKLINQHNNNIIKNQQQMLNNINHQQIKKIKKNSNNNSNQIKSAHITLTSKNTPLNKEASNLPPMSPDLTTFNNNNTNTNNNTINNKSNSVPLPFIKT